MGVEVVGRARMMKVSSGGTPSDETGDEMSVSVGRALRANQRSDREPEPTVIVQKPLFW